MYQTKKDFFFQKMDLLGLALTYDDVRLKSGYSEVEPSKVFITSHFSRNVTLNSPIVSAAMDTVTESPMAIAMAKFGGLGIIHKALTPEVQAEHVRRVKLHLNGLIEKPICVFEDQTIEEILRRQREKGYGFHSFPVLTRDGKLVGLLTRTDFELCGDQSRTAKEQMTPREQLLLAEPKTSLREAHSILGSAKKKVLPLITEGGELAGMYVFSDAARLIGGSHKQYNVDSEGHLRVGAAIGTGEDGLIRSELLVKAGCDVLVIDTAHGDSKNVIETLIEIKKLYSIIDVVVGNISEPESADRLANAGADGIKVGQGPGTICTTRIVAGIGGPQVTAAYKCSLVLRDRNVPVCADGGITYSGAITIAIGAGASSVMLGSMLAGTDESPGEVKDTSKGRVKAYRGMGSLGAMQASRAARERYLQDDAASDKIIPEGVEALVPYQGSVADVLFKQIGGLRKGMGYVGADSISALQEKADFHRITGAGLRESHPHDIITTSTT